MTAHFHDRLDAGRQLASKLARFAAREDVLVLGLPRGGVPVAYEVSRALEAPLDVFVVRKLGVPFHEELAMGAIATGGVRMVDQNLIRQLGLSEADVEKIAAREGLELERRARQYRGDRALPDFTGKTTILVDDGLATGASMRVAVEALKQEEPASVVVAVPVAPEETCAMLREEADEVVCAITPEPFYAVGLWYRDFSQTTDEEVRDLLERARQQSAAAPARR